MDIEHHGDHVGVGLVGCGLIGCRRAESVAERDDCKLLSVADIDPRRAESLASQFRCAATNDWMALVTRPDIQAVIVSTSNDMLAPVTIEALRNGKHVLCEKPLGRCAAEAEEMVAVARKSGVRLKVGFNHRYHPALQKAHELLRNGAIGVPYFVRAVYGHGGRSGYTLDWRMSRTRSGGGEMLDQGIHLIDLCRWFLGEFSDVCAFNHTYFWNASGAAPVEDNAFVMMRTAQGQVAQLHASWTQWKNKFTFELFGETGALCAEGLNGSYGPEKVIWTKRPSEFGVPDQQHFEFEAEDSSWRNEWADFVGAVQMGRDFMGSGSDGLEAMRLIAAIYESSRTGRVIHRVI